MWVVRRSPGSLTPGSAARSLESDAVAAKRGRLDAVIAGLLFQLRRMRYCPRHLPPPAPHRPRPRAPENRRAPRPGRRPDRRPAFPRCPPSQRGRRPLLGRRRFQRRRRRCSHRPPLAIRPDRRARGRAASGRRLRGRGPQLARYGLTGPGGCGRRSLASTRSPCGPPASRGRRSSRSATPGHAGPSGAFRHHLNGHPPAAKATPVAPTTPHTRFDCPCRSPLQYAPIGRCHWAALALAPTRAVCSDATPGVGTPR